VVTRPLRTPLSELVPPVMWAWCGLAASGAYLWLRREREGAHVPFLAMCALLFCLIVLGGSVAPRWFPFQPNRLTSTLNFMLAVPVGQAFAVGLRSLGFGKRSKVPTPLRLSGALQMRNAIAVVIIVAFVTLPVQAHGSNPIARRQAMPRAGHAECG